MHAAAPPCWPTLTSGPVPEGALADISRWRYISHIAKSIARDSPRYQDTVCFAGSQTASRQQCRQYSTTCCVSARFMLWGALTESGTGSGVHTGLAFT